MNVENILKQVLLHQIINLIKENHFDLILESVGLEITRHQAINSIAPGGTIVHIGLTQHSGTF